MKKMTMVLLTVLALLLMVSASSWAISSPPVLSGDLISVDQNAEISFADDSDWRDSVSQVTINGSATEKYTLNKGKLTIRSSAFPGIGVYLVGVKADGYTTAYTEVLVKNQAVPPDLYSVNTKNALGDAVVLAFADNEQWREAVNAVYLNDSLLSPSQYTLKESQLTLTAGCFSRAGNYEVRLQADGYRDTTATIAVLATDYYTVSFNSEGGSAVASQTAREGATVMRPSDPVKSGYNFGGWYLEENCLNLFNFSSPVHNSITVYARWDIATDSIPHGNTEINLYLNQKTYTINGNNRTLDVVPQLHQYGGVNYTLVPLRFIAEALGAEVNWQSATNSVSMVRNGIALTLKLNRIDPGSGLDCPAIIKHGRTLVPLRYVATSFDCTVNYQGSDQPIVITTN